MDWESPEILTRREGAMMKCGGAFCDTSTSLQGNQPDTTSTVLGNGRPDDNSF